ncbi:hypothetical protein MMC22_004164 [Lobaria immixta]|nr:hypothetical protein [Lobaria immixta]
MATKKRSTDQKNAAQALAGIKLYYDTAHIRSSPDSKVFNSTGYWEASKEYRTSREIYVAKTIKGATSVKVVAPVMTDETTAMKEDTSDPTNQITPVIPRAATFSAAAISYTVEDIQYVCIHGIELCPYPQFTRHSMGAALTPLVAADIYSIWKQKKLDLTLITFATIESA